MPTLGIKLSPQNCTIEELRAVWRMADEAGFDHLWGFDHFNPIFADVAGDVFEGMTLLAAMAEATSRVRIGLMVAGNTYRHPGVLAKVATTIDHLSSWRLEFGLGASGAEVEHTMLGIPFYTAGERIRRLGEALTVCRKLWTEERASFDGRYYTLTDAIANPKPLQRPYPPIWVGGAGEKLTLRVVAEHADVWNVIGSVEEVVRKALVLDQLRRGRLRPERDQALGAASLRPCRPRRDGGPAARLHRGWVHREHHLRAPRGRAGQDSRDRRRASPPRDVEAERAPSLNRSQNRVASRCPTVSSGVRYT